MRHERHKKVDVEVTICLLLCLWLFIRLGKHGLVFVAVPVVARFQKWRFHDDSSSDTADQPITDKHSDDITFSTCSDRLGTPREQILKEGTSTRCCDLMGTPENCGDPNVGADGKGAALLQGVTLAQSTHLDIKMK